MLTRQSLCCSLVLMGSLFHAALFTQEVHGWQGVVGSSRRSILARGLGTCAAALLRPASSKAQDFKDSSLPLLQDSSSGHPPIPLPSSTSEENLSKLQGLIFLKDPNKRPSPADTILITVRTSSQPDTVLAGARIPATKVQGFPFKFSLSSANRVDTTTEAAWREAAQTRDWLVQVSVCPPQDEAKDKSNGGLPQQSSLYTCQRNGGTPVLQASSLAKLLLLPNGVSIRAPASLGLE